MMYLRTFHVVTHDCTVSIESTAKTGLEALRRRKTSRYENETWLEFIDSESPHSVVVPLRAVQVIEEYGGGRDVEDDYVPDDEAEWHRFPPATPAHPAEA